MRTQAAALSRPGHAGYRCAWTSVALHSDPVLTYARAVTRQWAALYHGQAANHQQLADAWSFAISGQSRAATPAMTVRGPAGATVLFLRHLGYQPEASSPWVWFHPNCPDAEADIARDGQGDLDDAIGRAVSWDGWRMAAHRRNDLGDPDSREPLEMKGPAAALARAGPAERGLC